MSAFILSDLHFSTIAIYMHHLNDNIDIQELSNRLKSINIDSVDYRYNQKTRKTKCKIINNFDNVRYSQSDIIRLISCWDYQSCEKGDSLNYLIMSAFLYSFFNAEDINISNTQSNLWSI